MLPPLRAKSRPIPKSKHVPSLLATFIEAWGEALDVSFLYISDVI